MADFTINDVSTKAIDSVIKTLTLTEGQKITDDADCLSMASMLVPAGYEVVIEVRMRVKSVTVV
jgi:hypothetical protein